MWPVVTLRIKYPVGIVPDDGSAVTAAGRICFRAPGVLHVVQTHYSALGSSQGPASRNCNQGGAKPELAEPVVRRGVDADRRPAVLDVVAPTGPAAHAFPARTGPSRISHAPPRKRALVQVRTPLPHVPMHIVQSPRIRQLLTYTLCPIRSVVPTPPHVLVSHWTGATQITAFERVPT